MKTIILGSVQYFSSIVLSGWHKKTRNQDFFGGGGSNSSVFKVFSNFFHIYSIYSIIY